MSECSTCPSNSSCSEEKKNDCGYESMIVKNPYSNIKNVIGVMSGKGGVGKSTISALLAKQLKNEGYSVGVLDADITGPSIPRLLNISNERAFGKQDGSLIPVNTTKGIKVISLNLLVENENEPVIWRGPMVGEVVKQFYKDVHWGELDYLVIDMPPGTGDVALTAMQSLPIDGIVMVSTPQEMVSMIVSKAVNMAKTMNIELLGLVENMSYVMCPDCDKEIRMFDNEGTDKFLEEMNLELLAEFPMTQSISQMNKDSVNEKVNETLKNMTEKIREKLDNK